MDLTAHGADLATNEGLQPRSGRPLSVAIGMAGMQLGGCQINAIDLGRVLRQRGHEVTIFGVRDDAVTVSIEPYAASAGFTIDLFDDRAGTWATARSITRLADAHRADVVHAFAPWLGRIVGLASASWRGDRSAVETNWNMENAFWGSPRVPLIVGTGAMLAEAQSRVSVAHLMEPPVDLEMDRPDPVAAASFRRAHGISSSDQLIVIVTRVDRAMKGDGILRAISALVSLARPDLRLVVVGDGDAYRDVVHAAAAANVQLGRPAVVVIGSMLDPRPAYAAADIVLGMGGSAIRALAHGKPLVVLGESGFALTYEPAVVQYFRREGFYGVGCSGDSVAHLAALVGELSDDPARRITLGAFGLAEAESRFGLDAAAAALEAIYRSAIDHAASRPTRIYHAAHMLTRAALARGRSTIARVTR